MATFSFAQLQQALQQAGLDSASSAIGAAIALAESGGRSDAVGDQGTSFGPWQIHLPAHPDVTQACAMDLMCAAAATVKISSGGTNWNPWTTFQTGAYRAFLGGQGVIQSVQGAAQAAVHWIVSLGFGQTGPSGETEVGTDLAVPVGTSVFTPFSGVIQLEDRGKAAWGKRALITIDSGPLQGFTFGVGHLTDFAGLMPGQHVDAGSLIGHSGGAKSDPSSGNSTGPHIEVQILNASKQFLDPQQVLAKLGMGFGAVFAGLGGGLPNPLAGPEQAIAGAITDALSRLGYILLAIALLALGLFLIVVGSVPWDRVGRAAAGATPAGRVAAAAGSAA